MSKKKRTFYIFFTLILLSIFLLTETITFQRKKLLVNVTYPVYSLKPHYADDWTSFFIMNHIYLRFTENEGLYRNRSPISKVIECEDRRQRFTSSDCKRVKVSYQFKKAFKGCNGSEYSEDQFKVELSEITKKKGWIFPHFKWCEGNLDCFTFDNLPNIQNHFNSIYLRFGWSLKTKYKTYGIHPICFNAETVDGNIIKSGVIQTPDLDVKISTKEKNADIFLYGGSSEPGIKELNFFNPIYFYWVTSGLIASESLNRDMNNIIPKIRKELLEMNVTSSTYGFEILQEPQMSHVLPEKKLKKRTSVILPDYIEDCNKLANKLTNGDFLFQCMNITNYVEEVVKKLNKWDSFISPLTPGLPGRTALITQYFSTTSEDSWLGHHLPESSIVKSLGTSSAKIQVKAKEFCSIKPNSLGLSDITVDDFIYCD